MKCNLTKVAKTVNSKTFLKQMPLTAAIIKLVKFFSEI